MQCPWRRLWAAFQEGAGSSPGDSLCTSEGSPSLPRTGNWELQWVLPGASQFQDTVVLMHFITGKAKHMFVLKQKVAFPLLAVLQSLESRQYQNHSASPSFIWAVVPGSLAWVWPISADGLLSSWAESWACRSLAGCSCHFGAGRRTANAL